MYKWEIEAAYLSLDPATGKPIRGGHLVQCEDANLVELLEEICRENLKGLVITIRKL